MGPLDRRRQWKLTDYQHMEQSPAWAGYQWEPDPELRRRLREATGLEPVLAALPDDWEKLLALMNFVHGVSGHQGCQEAPDLSALSLLAMARTGEVVFRCVEFAHLLQQVCAAFGHAARVVGLRRAGSDDGLGRGHVVVDVWSPAHAKWIMLDPQFNMYYRDRAGSVLAPWEIADRVHAAHFGDLRLSGEAELAAAYTGHEAQDNIDLGQVEVPDGFDRGEVWRSLPAHGGFPGFLRFWQEYYWELVYRTRYGLTRTRSPGGSEGAGVPLYYHREGELPPLLFQRLPQQVRYITDRSRLDVPLEGVELQWAPHPVPADAPLAATRRLDLMLRHSMPWFDHYEVSQGGPWRPHRRHQLRVRLTAGANQLAVRAVNDLGRTGSAARLALVVN